MNTDAAPSRRTSLILLIIVAAIISGVGWLRLRPDSSMEPLLPEHSPARQTILFFRDSTFANKAILWFRLTGDGTPPDLLAAADQTEKNLNPALISQVVRPPKESAAVDEAMGLLDHAGELLNESDLADLQNATAPDALKKRMRESYLELTKPEGSFYQQIIRSDPLGVSNRILGRLYAMKNGMNYNVEIKDGRLMHTDGRQLMMVLETSTTATSIDSSKALVAHLSALCAAAPPNVRITAICGQIHTEQNESIMRRDMQLAGTINSIAFLLLFLCVSRDWRVAAVFLLPVFTMALTVGYCALVYPHISTMMLGLTLAMAGSAVDYGIFVYTAIWMGRDPSADLRRILRPLLISHLTTLGVFVAFLFSKIPAYRQLGYLTSISLVLSLLSAIYILPKLLKPRGKITGLGRGMSLGAWGKLMIPVTFIAAVALIVAIVIASRVKFDPDITRLDGVSAAVKQDEANFQKTWSTNNKDMAILVVTAKTRAQAEEANDQIYRIVSPKFDAGQFTSLTSFWPSAATRRDNLSRWQSFWSPDRIARLRTDLTAAGEPYGFAASAFDPFFKTLTSPPPADAPRLILSSIEGQFTARSGNDWQMLSYFQDTPENISLVTNALADRPDAQVVSRGVLTQAFKASAVSETHILVGISVAFIACSLLVLTRSLVRSIIIILPVITGLVVMLATLELTHLSMSVVTVIASIIVLALTSDYGVFAAYACENRETILGQGMASVHLSFFTTLAGTGVMIFAHHPALYMVGVSLTAGLTAGYLTSFFIIPGIYYFWSPQKQAPTT